MPPTLTPGRQGVLSRLASLFAPAPSPRYSPYQELGVSGTAVYGGYVRAREKSAKWTGTQRYITIADMVVNASIIAAGVHYFIDLLAHPAWSVRPADESAEAQQAAEFLEEVLHDMDQSWSRIVRRAAMYRFYGFGVQEWTAKKRADGRVGLASVEPRPQATIERWAVSPSGAVEGVWQRSPQDGTERGIPRSKIMYMVEDALSDSPEGLGMFRHLAAPWERLQTYYELEARAYERDLRGVPIGRVPYGLLRQAVKNGEITQAEADLMKKAIEDFVGLKMKESNTSLVLDSAMYYSEAADGQKVSSSPLYGLEILQGSSNGVAELGQAITRTQTEMARILACENLLMGESSGNRALSEDKSRNLYLVANAALSDILEAVDRDLVTPIWLLNGLPDELRPILETEDVAFKDADSVASTLQKMAQAGAVLAPDDPVIKDVRGLMGVSSPPPSPPPEEIIPPMGPEPDGSTLFLVPDEPTAKKAAPRSLYVKRPLLNGDEVRAWAARQGFASTLPADDMHVTVMFSREPVDWDLIEPDEAPLVALATAGREVHQFPQRAGPGPATVLRFEAPALHQRWQELIDAGASYDFAEYLPHVTLTYALPEGAVESVEPYTGRLVFGGEEFAEVNEDWGADIAEQPITAVPRDPMGSGQFAPRSSLSKEAVGKPSAERVRSKRE